MSKLILFFKSHPFVLSLVIGVVSVSTAVTAVLLPGPQGEPGKEVEFRVTNESIEYRYEGDTEYSSLIDLSQLRGPIGENGKQVIFDINDTHIIWRYSDQNTWINLILLDSLKGLTGRNGTSVELDATSTHIVWKYEDDQTWTNLIDLSLLKGQDGNDGRDVEFQTSETHLQWRYIGETSWNNLIALSLLTGANGVDGIDGVDGTNGVDGINGTDGREVEFQTSDTHLQWRYVEDVSWNDLIALSLLTGADGVDGTNGTNGTDGVDGINGTDGREVEFQTNLTHIQWRFVGDETWINLVALSLITGQDGTNGIDGREVEFQSSSTHLQWRYEGETSWNDLFLLSSLTGDNGISVSNVTTLTTAVSSQILYSFNPSNDYETNLVMDPDLNVLIQVPYEVNDPFNPNLTIIYSGYGDDSLGNSPLTGNYPGYEFYFLDGTTTTDFYFDTVYYSNELLNDVEVRITYDLNYEVWFNDARLNENYVTDVYDERHIIYVDQDVAFANNSIKVPAGSTNVLVEMIVIGDIKNDIDLGYYLLDVQPLESLYPLNFAYGGKIDPDTYDINLVADFDDPTDNTFYYMLATKDGILFNGQDTVTGTLESLGIGTGTYTFTSFDNDGQPSILTIDGILTETIYVYAVITTDDTFNRIDFRDSISTNRYFRIRERQFNPITFETSFLVFELSDSTSIEIPFDELFENTNNLDDFYFDIHQQIIFEIDRKISFIPIYDLEDFQNIELCSSCNYILMDDIFFNNDFVPISLFSGTLDGNDYTLRGFSSMPSTISTNYGIFRILSDATIRNINIDTTTFTAENESGLLAGRANRRVDLMNLSITIGTTDLSNQSGLLVGDINENSHVVASNIKIKITISSSLSYSGLLFGSTNGGNLDLQDIEIEALLVKSKDIFGSGAIIGEAMGSEIDLSNISLNIKAFEIESSNVGGLIGKLINSTLTLTSLYSDITMTQDLSNSPAQNASNIGGLIGESETSEIYMDNIHLGFYDPMQLYGFESHVGGLIGFLNNSTLFLNDADARIGFGDINHSIGGFFGEINNSEVSIVNAFVYVGMYDITSKIGGVIGVFNQSAFAILESTISGSIGFNLGNSNALIVGGIIGDILYTNNNSALFFADVTSNVEIRGESFLGGFIGRARGTEYNVSSNTYSYNGVSSSNSLDIGFIRTLSQAKIEGTGVIIGGYIGEISGGEIDFENTTSSSIIIGGQIIGGFIGGLSNTNSEFRYARTYGVLNGNSAGGFIGTILGTSRVRFDTSVSDLLYGVGISNGDLYSFAEANSQITIINTKQDTEEFSDNT